MTHLIHVIKSAGKNTKTPLGRWGQYEDITRGLVVDYSNEDHCGTCGEYINSKLPQPSSHSNIAIRHINTHNNESFNSYDYNNMLEAEYSHIVVNTPN